jgi:hypothetical protein
MSLIAIGALGMREAKSWTYIVDTTTPCQDSKVRGAMDCCTLANIQSCFLWEQDSLSAPGGDRAVLLNGFLHGFSWDGMPSLAPALALPSMSAVSIFLFAYSVGTVVSMSVASAIVGEGSLRVGQTLERVSILVISDL